MGPVRLAMSTRVSLPILYKSPTCLPVCSRWHPIPSPLQKLSSHLGNDTWAQGSTQLLDTPFDPTTVPFRVTERLMSNV